MVPGGTISVRNPQPPPLPARGSIVDAALESLPVSRTARIFRATGSLKEVGSNTLMRSLILECSEPCPHERVFEPPGHRSPGEILAQEMLVLERLERTLH